MLDAKVGDNAIDWPAVIASNAAGTPDLSVTRPRAIKLTIDDLVTLDKVWEQDDRYRSTELIDGIVYHTPARYRPRAFLVSELAIAIQQGLERIGSPLSVGIRGSIAMPPHDLPLPDIVLTNEIDGEGFIPVCSVALMVEVAESALDFFLGDKLRIYAKHGVPEYWVADLNARVIHQMWSPSGNGFARRRECEFGVPVTMLTIANVTVDTPGF